MANKPIKRVDSRGRVTWQQKWRYGGEGRAWQSVTLDKWKDADALRVAVESRGHMVLATDTDVLDLSIITGRATREHAAAGITFLAAAEDFFTNRSGVKPQTVHTQRSVLRNHLVEWHDIPVAALTSDDAAQLVNRLEGRRLDPRPAIRLSKAVMNRAIAQGHYSRANPLVGVRMRKVVQKPMRRVSGTDFAALLAQARSDDDRMLLRLALQSGIREGELMALQPEDLDGNVIHVRGTVTRGEHTRWVVDTPKDGEPREVELLPELADELRAFSRGRRWLFPNPDGDMQPPTSVISKFGRMVRRAEQDGSLSKHVRFHDLRHTHVQELIEQGWDLWEIKQRVGHSTYALTADLYGRHARSRAGSFAKAMRAVEAQREAATRPTLRAV